MKKFISGVIGLFALFGIMSNKANAQYVQCGSVFTAPHGRVAGTVGFAARECDPPRQQRTTRLPYPGGLTISPRPLGAHAVPLNRPLIVGSQQHRVVQRSSNTYGVQRTQQAQMGWKPSVDCESRGGTRTINPNTGAPSCFVPDRR